MLPDTKEMNERMSKYMPVKKIRRGNDVYTEKVPAASDTAPPTFTWGVAEYNDFRPIERYILEMVQDRSYVSVNY